MKVAVGIPAFNEEGKIAKILASLNEITDTVIVCDDGSTDMTEKIAVKMGAIVVKHEKNLGYGAAIRDIFLKAREIDCDVLVTFDADGQHRIEDINSVLLPIQKNEADIVIGSRFLDNAEKKIPKFRKVGIKTINKLTNVSGEQKISDTQSGFRAYSKKVLEAITPSDNGMGVSTEILIKANSKKFKIKEVPIVILYGKDTSTHNTVSHGISVISSTMKFLSIERPMLFYGLPGLIFLVIGMFFILWTLQEFSETRRIITNISLIGIGSTIMGMILIMTSVILYSLVSVVRERTR